MTADVVTASFNPSQENTAVLTEKIRDPRGVALSVSTPLRKTRPSSRGKSVKSGREEAGFNPSQENTAVLTTYNIDAKIINISSFNPSQENTAVLTYSDPTVFLYQFVFQPLSGKHGRPHVFARVARRVGQELVSTPLRKTRPSSPTAASNTVITIEEFQPLSGKHGRPHGLDAFVVLRVAGFNPSQENTAVLTIIPSTGR